MRFYRDSDKETPIRWFFCDSKAKNLPFWTRFASANWLGDKRRKWIGVGEVQGAKRTYDRGNNSNQKVGNHYCGSELLYAQGLLTTESYVRDPDCCKANPLDFCLLQENGEEILLEDLSGCIQLEH